MKLKKCRGCGLEKETFHFHKSLTSKDGFFYRCKECESQYRKNKDEEAKTLHEINAFIMENLKTFDGKIRLGINEHVSMTVNKFRPIRGL